MGFYKTVPASCYANWLGINVLSRFSMPYKQDEFWEMTSLCPSSWCMKQDGCNHYWCFCWWWLLVALLHPLFSTRWNKWKLELFHRSPQLIKNASNAAAIVHSCIMQLFPKHQQHHRQRQLQQQQQTHTTQIQQNIIKSVNLSNYWQIKCLIAFFSSVSIPFGFPLVSGLTTNNMLLMFVALVCTEPALPDDFQKDFQHLFKKEIYMKFVVLKEWP